MPTALLHPGVYIEEVPSGVRTITGVATSITLFIGWAPKGPADKAVRITSYADYERTYGGLDMRSLLGYAVRQFYDNGGSDAYVVRIAAGDAVTALCDLGDLRVNASSPGAWASLFNVMLTVREAPFADRFRLDVIDPLKPNVVLESFANLSLDEADSRFAPKIVNDHSAFMGDLSLTTTPAGAPASTPSPGLNLAGGDDGTVLAPTGATAGTFHTAVTDLFKIGAIADRIDLFNIICVPGLVDGPTIQAMQTSARNRRAFLLVDCEESADVASLQTAGALPIGSDAANSAFYFPWVKAPDPRQSGALRDFPPSGFAAGILARTDARRGVWKAPAGTEAALNGSAALKIAMSDAENGQLNPLAVNCLRDLPVYGRVVWGARTLVGNDARGDEWKYLPVRRTALFIEESLYRGTQWVVFEPNDEPLWAQIRLNIGAFMNGLFRQGAFQGVTPKEAYFVKCDRETTTQADINLGIVNILVGFAPLKPAEFVVIKIQQMAGEIQT